MPTQPRARLIGPVEVSLLALLVLLVAFSVLVALDPRVASAAVDEELEIVLMTISGIGSGALALLLWGRYREGEGLEALLRASAFTTLGLIYVPILCAQLLGASVLLGMSLAAPGQLPVIVGLMARGVAATLLVAAGMAGLRAASTPMRRGLVIALGPAIAVLALAGIGAFVQDSLPMLVTDSGLAQLRARPDQPLLAAAVVPVLILLQAFIGALYLAASGLSYRLYRRDGRDSEGLLAFALVLAAFSQVHYAINPGGYTGLVTSGDILRVAFYAALLAGVVVETRGDVRALRMANADLRRLREAELASAALEERARLAREIHDGLAQDLWYAKLKQGRLVQASPDASEARHLAGEVATAIDAALAEARQAVMALRPQLAEGGSLAEVITRYVEDFGDRFGLRTELHVDDEAPMLTPRAQAEVLRILQEALNNVRKHADATTVRVRVVREPELVRVEIADNGRGFDPASVEAQRFGLASMRERAELIGGRLEL
ncbi:MAG: sensor histidine kinase, partial [Candidatus Limnocylindria bacterium]